MNYRTDLAVEAHTLTKNEAEKIEGVISKTFEDTEYKKTIVEVINEKGEKAIGKRKGKYITLEIPDIKYSNNAYESACKAIAEEIKSLANIKSDTLTLVVGLGNNYVTPDRLGVKVAEGIFVTNHLKKQASEIFGDSLSSVCAITPGVLGTTGIESAEIVKNVSKGLNPNLIIVVDALAAADHKRIGITVQITDTGISPGAGVGNNRASISKDELNIPVIAIGVPTVVDASTLSQKEPTGGGARLIVTPKDIDIITDKCSKTIANGINLALHPALTLKEIEEYVS